MRLKLFRAATMPEAMARVRAELGADALILSTRRVGDGVEITAALEPPDPRPPTPLPDPARTAALAFHAVPAPLHPALHAGPLTDALAALLTFQPLPLSPDSPPLLLSGPPGAGKTLTAARLASRLVMSGVAPMVITADGNRAGATEQLAAFTRILGVSLTVACHPVTLGRALTRRPPGSPVLIDAPGHDPFNPAHAEHLAALAGTANATIVVIMPAGLDPAESADLAAAYAEAGATLMVATRLDIARRLGGLLSAAAAGRLALTEAGVGPGAADGLVPLTPDLLAERLLQIRNPSHAARPAHA
ncbi:MAG TPA: GTP-binding protein [Acetobacteraceae bacterium]|jgi:flagellar biosynthesis protein FlhF